MTPKHSWPFATALLTAGLALASSAWAADWPQWRGPARNGIQADSPPLAEQWPATGLAKLWDSEMIPADDDGGHGSVVAAGGRVYAAIVWHTDTPTETRAIDDLVLRQIGYQSVAGWPKETVAKMEHDRQSLDPSLTGEAFNKYVNDWIASNLDSHKQQTSGGYVRTRFDRRGDAIPLEVYDRLLTVSKKRFPDQAALVAWLTEQNFGEKVTKEILAAVPPTMKVAEDVVISLDLATGKTLWKCSSPGEAVGRTASSTPCVADGRVYALGSTHAYAVDAASGKLLWSAPLPAKGPAASPLAVAGALILNAGKLTALDAATGQPLWTQPKAGGGNSSPVAWQTGDQTLILCQGRGVLAAVDAQTGALRWTTPAGGDCTPAIAQDLLAVQTGDPKIGILAGRLAADGFTKLWNTPYNPLRSQSSPLILGGHVYLMDDNQHFCLDLLTGQQRWKEKSGGSSITSPACADGKIFLVTSGGSKIIMLKPSPEKRTELAKANIRVLGCPSPAIADGKLLLRGRKGITCYRLPGAGS
ncbi:MAG: PQQ-binding-like beta-propeller repeat protein [Verrucomicrobiota bacterium]